MCRGSSIPGTRQVVTRHRPRAILSHPTFPETLNIELKQALLSTLNLNFYSKIQTLMLYGEVSET